MGWTNWELSYLTTIRSQQWQVCPYYAGICRLSGCQGSKNARHTIQKWCTLTKSLLHLCAGLKRLSNLNTLVLKQNAIARLGSSLHKCSALQKLSMAHNQLTEIGDALMHCTALKELRLNHNAIIQLPPELSHNSQLRIVDIGDNPIGDTASIKVQLCSTQGHCEGFCGITAMKYSSRYCYQNTSNVS